MIDPVYIRQLRNWVDVCQVEIDNHAIAKRSEGTVWDATGEPVAVIVDDRLRRLLIHQLKDRHD